MKQHFQARKWEYLLLFFIMAVAIFIRLWRLEWVPDGLHYDEAIDLMEGRRLLGGDWFFYTPAGWGREGIYYYGVALCLALVREPILALRLATVLFGLSTILSGYGLARRLTGAPTALLTAGCMAVLQWHVFESRIGLRNITVLALLLPAAWAFWWAYSALDEVPADPANGRKGHLARFALAGGLLGLTLYTYQPARFAPFIFLLFAAYLAICHRARFRQLFTGFAVYGVTAAIVALPLLLLLLQGSAAEAQRQWTIEPLLRLLDGDPSLVWQNLLATLKMFSIQGDPLVTYNLPGRPVFVPVWTSLFFYVGLALALWRWRQPRYALLLGWLVVMTLPTLLTISAPNYNRLLGMLFVVVLLAALPLGEAIEYGYARWGRNGAALPLVLGLLVLAGNMQATWRDYFTLWAEARPENYAIQYNMATVAITRDIMSQPADGTYLVNTRSLGDADPFIAASIVGTYLPNLRWVDTARAVAFPAGVTEVQLYLAEERQLDHDLATLMGIPAQPERAEPRFELYTLPLPAWPAGSGQATMPLAADQLFKAEQWQPEARVTLPLSFAGRLQLDSVQLLQEESEAGSPITLFTYWTILADGEPAPLAFFLHLLGESGDIVSQEDGLGYLPHSWRAGDRFVHVHHLATDAQLPAGPYWLQLGLYDQQSLARWPVDATTPNTTDRLIIGQVTLR
ncbi:MAG: glycosyltransferase family 39 protein [Anaerolineales bacterium]|nr:glycosyltransferase family 39 protein [Anaerolineales bacterium]